MPDLSLDVRQHDTHKELVGQSASPMSISAGNLDAIVVPASRPAANLDHAVTLARAAGCHLVVLCSRDAKGSEVNQLLAARSFDGAVVIDLPDNYSHHLMSFDTSLRAKSYLPEACTSYSTDLSVKRNIGLLLARMLNWERLFYLDDDIRDISYPGLCRTVSMLGPYHSAGMRVVKYPDNSVVCHAHRETGAFQDVFVSGSALAVDSSGYMSFFPDIYNEDWLFFYDDVAKGKLASSGINATQLRYDPFADPQRAAWQEFGDVLAEGLYGLLHQRGGAADANCDYWAYFLKARQSFLQAIIDRSGQAEAQVRDSMLAAVRKALECSMQIQPEVCELYVGLWQQDLRRWKQRLTDVPRGLSLERALMELNLRSSVDCGKAAGGIRRDREGMPAGPPPGPVAIPNVPTLDGSWNVTRPALGSPDLVTARTDDTLPMLGFLSPDAGIRQALPNSRSPAEPWRGRYLRIPNIRPWRRAARSVVAAGIGQDAGAGEAALSPAAVTIARP
jgi:hypothetical protein